MKKLLLVGCLIAITGCTDDRGATRAVKAQLGQNVKVELLGYSAFGCGKDSNIRTKFRATKPDGTVVTGVVCKDLLRGSAVRIY